ncbi:hypothetical protein HanIR_Chr07g0341761 [Helianthus annuus]|nr:hypothetical protein HanIR_Chr07g0341761 [Helianthus annuus]
MVLSRSYDDLKSLLPIDFGMAMMISGRSEPHRFVVLFESSFLKPSSSLW